MKNKKEKLKQIIEQGKFNSMAEKRRLEWYLREMERREKDVNDAIKRNDSRIDEFKFNMERNKERVKNMNCNCLNDGAKEFYELAEKYDFCSLQCKCGEECGEECGCCK